jgi:hypothetical protein
MPRQFIGLSARALVAGALTLGFVICAQPLWAAAYAPGQQLSTQTIQEFTNNPSQVLTQFPNGGGQMISRLRDLLASDPAVLSPILTLIANANKDQKSAIGAALAQAAKLYGRSDQTFANQIQQAVANTQDQELIVAYAASAGDQPIGGIGGGGSGGGPGGGSNPLGGPAGGTGAAQGIGPSFTDTGAFSVTGGPTGNGFNNTNTNNTNTANNVSP